MRVSLLLCPEALASSLLGPLDLLRSAGYLAPEGCAPLQVNILAQRRGALNCFHGVALAADASFEEVEHTDLIFVPSLAIEAGGPRRLGAECEWLQHHARRGARLASTCTGAFLLALTGQLDGRPATTHWAYAEQFRARFPEVLLQPDRALVDNGDTLTTAGGLAWQDLMIHLVAQWAGGETALKLQQFYLLQQHLQGQQPLAGFSPRPHGDPAMRAVEAWLALHFREAGAAEGAVAHSGMNLRRFQRRFLAATGLTLVHYLQRLRVEAAKLALREGRLPVEAVCYAVGYADPASFRRLFRRLTGLSPKAYQLHFCSGAGRVAESGG